MKTTLAILSPNQNAYSETFIQAHRQLPFPIKYYYDGSLPTKLEGTGELSQFNLKQRIEKRLNQQFTMQEHALLNSLKAQKIDIVLAEYGPTACACLPVIKHAGIPLLVHFHGYDASVIDLLEKYGEQYRRVFSYAKAVIVVSTKMKETLIGLGCPKEKLIMAVYGPAPEYFNVQPTYNTQQFLSIGRFVEKKAPYLTILAFKKVVEKFPQSQLIMVGEGALLPVCKNLVNALGLQGKVIFKGIQNASGIQLLLKNSIAFVQHSITAENGDAEGTPVAVIEAQAAGLPVIATMHAGIPEVVINNITGLLVEEYDVAKMSHGMQRVLTEERLASELGQRGREHILTNFTLEKYLGSIAEIIRNLIIPNAVIKSK